MTLPATAHSLNQLGLHGIGTASPPRQPQRFNRLSRATARALPFNLERKQPAKDKKMKISQQHKDAIALVKETGDVQALREWMHDGEYGDYTAHDDCPWAEGKTCAQWVDTMPAADVRDYISDKIKERKSFEDVREGLGGLLDILKESASPFNALPFAVTLRTMSDGWEWFKVLGVSEMNLRRLRQLYDHNIGSAELVLVCEDDETDRVPESFAHFCDELAGGMVAGLFPESKSTAGDAIRASYAHLTDADVIDCIKARGFESFEHFGAMIAKCAIAFAQDAAGNMVSQKELARRSDCISSMIRSEKDGDGEGIKAFFEFWTVDFFAGQ